MCTHVIENKLKIKKEISLVSKMSHLKEPT